jgi:tripartite-type tricarboxylate transporter receptor subunit TctC
MNLPRRTLLAGFLAAPAIGRAEGGFPSRPIRYLCPFPPGATNDNVSRTMSRALSVRLGQPVIVENRGGAGGAIGARAVAESRADGYTLLNASAGNLTIAPHLGPVGYDPLRAFAPVAMVGESFSLIAVNPELPVRSLDDLIAFAQRNPGVLNYASAGIGSAGHLRGALLAEAGDAEMVHVPFPGSAGAVNSVIAGDSHIILDPIAAPHALSGRLRPIATIGEVRWPAFPDVPATEERGVGRDWPSGGWFGLFAPAQTPPAIVATLNRAFNEALLEPEVDNALRRFGLRPEPLLPAELGVRLAADHAASGAAIRRLGIA